MIKEYIAADGTVIKKDGMGRYMKNGRRITEKEAAMTQKLHGKVYEATKAKKFYEQMEEARKRSGTLY